MITWHVPKFDYLKRSDMMGDVYSRDDYRISLAILISFVVLAVQYFVLMVFNLYGTPYLFIISLVSKFVVAIVYFYGLPSVLRRLTRLHILAVLFSCLIFFISFSFFEENRTYLLNGAFDIFFMSLPAFIFASSIRNWTAFLNLMQNTAIIVYIFCITLSILSFVGYVKLGTYSMSLSYFLLYPTIVYLDNFLNKRRVFSGFIFISSMLSILAIGSRGAVLCIIVFAMLRFLFPLEKRKLSNVLSRLVVVVFIIIGLALHKTILSLLYNFLLERGIYSRSLRLFLEGDLHLIGRDRIFANITEAINQNRLFGLGLMGDRVAAEGQYAHNIFLEFIADFGIVFGTLISIMTIVMIAKTLYEKDPVKKRIVIMWISLGFVHLMVSSSYLIDIKFWSLIGIIVAMGKKENSFYSN